jgi:hypothetical protein
VLVAQHQPRETLGEVRRVGRLSGGRGRHGPISLGAPGCRPRHPEVPDHRRTPSAAPFSTR